jgi:mRNA-degrading endonuclease toxin of MazEF toxin-antitoxin module
VGKPEPRRFAPKELVPKIVPGAVFMVSEDVLNFPGERLGRVTKDYDARRVIIVQGSTRNRTIDVSTVLVVPCSASRGGVSLGNAGIDNPGAAGFTKPNIVALANLLQPVLKGDLEQHVGNISVDELGALRTAILQNLDVYQDEKVALPPR